MKKIITITFMLIMIVSLFLGFPGIALSNDGENTYLLVQNNPEIQSLAGRWILSSSNFMSPDSENEKYYFEIEVRGRETIMYKVAKHDFHWGGGHYIEKGTKREQLRFRINGRRIEGNWNWSDECPRCPVTGLVSEDRNEIKFSLRAKDKLNDLWFHETYQRE